MVTNKSTQNLKTLNVGFFGHGPWSHEALRQLIANEKYKVTFVATRKIGDAELKKISDTNRIPFFIPENINAKENVQKFTTFECDFFVSMSFNQIFETELINLPLKGIINCHAGALPFYRGRNVLNWAIINGEKQFGVTAHYIDEGIDTGDIICQRFGIIDQDDTYSSVLLKAYELCPKVLMEGLDLASVNAPTVKQKNVHAVGTYYGKRKEGDEWINWSWSSERIFNFIRAISPPGPSARALINGEEVLIERSQLLQNSKDSIGTCGEIVGYSDVGIIVKTGSSVIEVSGLCFKSSKKNISFKELKIGARFETEMSDTLFKLIKRVNALENKASGKHDDE